MSSPDRNETVHDQRRLHVPPSGPEPRRSRLRVVATIVVAVVASLAAGYAVASLLDGSRRPPRAGAAAATMTMPRGQGTVGQVPGGTLLATTPAAPPAADPQPKLPSPDPPATPSAGPPAAPSVPANSGSFDAPVPKGWREEEFATQQQGYLQSRWSDPRDPRTFVVINWIDGDRRLPADVAATLRAAVASQPDYREVRFTATRGRGWIWVYTILDDKRRRAARIDLISRRCGVLFAVLGSTTRKRFARLQPTFVAISEGIRIKSRTC